jgi:hypothetical protein
MALERFVFCASLFAGSLVAGCDSSSTQTVPVSGQVRFGGGPCPADGTISFSPVAAEDGVPRRPGIARFKTDGRFTVTSFNEGDGLVPGTYTPIISCWLGEPSNRDPQSFDKLNAVPSNFKPETIVVKPSSDPISVEINVPKKK